MNKLTLCFLVVAFVAVLAQAQKQAPPPHGTFDLPNGKPSATRPSGSVAVPIPARQTRDTHAPQQHKPQTLPAKVDTHAAHGTKDVPKSSVQH